MSKSKDDWLISVDDHLIEPRDLWTSRLPRQYQDAAPQVREDSEGEAWRYEDKRIPIMGTTVSAGVSPEMVDPRPTRYADISPSCYEPTARLKQMDEDGILASMVFPTVPRFCGQLFHEARDKELSLLCLRAYNDFILEEWRDPSPSRMIANIIIPLWDPHEAANEINRCSSMGAKSAMFSELPPALGLPSIHDAQGYWDPVFSAASDADIPLSIHIGSSSRIPTTSEDAPRMIASVLLSWGAATTCVDWLFSDVLPRYPKLRITLSEGGIGWVPFMLERAEGMVAERRYLDRFKMVSNGATQRFIGFATEKAWPHENSPTGVFREHIRGCFIAKYSMAREAIDQLGSDIFMAESDFPHGDSSFPHTRQQTNALLDGLEPNDQRKLRRDNAASWYHLDELVTL